MVVLFAMRRAMEIAQVGKSEGSEVLGERMHVETAPRCGAPNIRDFDATISRSWSLRIDNVVLERRTQRPGDRREQPRVEFVHLEPLDERPSSFRYPAMRCVKLLGEERRRARRPTGSRARKR